MLKTVLAVALLCVISVNAEAQPMHTRCNIDWPCVAPSASTPDQARVTRGRYIARQLGFGGPNVKRAVRASHRSETRAVAPRQRTASVPAQVIGGRPHGCPHRFCGCGASIHLFGKIIPALNLAANWLRFPRAAPAPKMAAARRGHVFVLERHISGNIWLVHDSNSGRGKTRLHARSIAGYVIVNPHGAG